MKFLFLDIDGVLNTYYTKQTTKTGTIDILDKKLLLIKELVDKTNAKIILSSTWSLGYFDLLKGQNDTKHAIDFLHLNDKFQSIGLEFFSFIAQPPNKPRGENIHDWIIDFLKSHSIKDIKSIVILDDNNQLRPYGYFGVKTSVMVGVIPKQINRCVKVLETYSFNDWYLKHKDLFILKD